MIAAFYGLFHCPGNAFCRYTGNLASQTCPKTLLQAYIYKQRSVMDLESKVHRYYQLKQQQKEMEGKLNDLRHDIMNHCA